MLQTKDQFICNYPDDSKTLKEIKELYAELVTSQKEAQKKILTLPLSVFQLSKRAITSLSYAPFPIETVEDLCKLDRKTLMRLKNFGQKTLVEVEDFLHSIDLQLDYFKEDGVFIKDLDSE